jgi:hypothetical protein
MFRDAALILPSYGGYIVEQPLMEISKMCKKNNILLIEDASGSLSSKKLCNGRFSDIIVASFGKGKIVDNGCGGFISANDKAFLGSEVSSLTKPIGIDYSRLSSKIENAPHRLAMLRKEHDAVKRDLLQFPIIHSEREGINVAVSFKTEQEKMKIIKYCDGKGLSYTLCPRYIRIMEEAVSIEIKRMSGDDSNERA